MIKTGDENDAGTDANVNFQMFGEKGKTQNFSLREEGDKKRFEKGRMDKFLIRTRDIGKVLIEFLFVCLFLVSSLNLGLSFTIKFNSFLHFMLTFVILHFLSLLVIVLQYQFLLV